MKEVILIKDLPNIRITTKSGKRKTRNRCLCQCHCGKVFETSKDNFKNGGVRSCGCKQHTGDSFRTHGMSTSKEYHCWIDMKMRCYNQNNEAYHNYGGRGIKVSDQWVNSFETFFKDMGKCPENKKSIDRILVNGDYSKENCRWADFDDQSNNKRNSKFLTFNNKTQTQKQWSVELNISQDLIKNRLKRGWSIEDTFTKPIRKMKDSLKAEKEAFLG